MNYQQALFETSRMMMEGMMSDAVTMKASSEVDKEHGYPIGKTMAAASIQAAKALIDREEFEGMISKDQPGGPRPIKPPTCLG